MLEPVVALLRQAGTAGVLLAIVSTIMWMTVVLRAVALFPRCYRGHHDRARFVASVYGPPASVHHHPPPGHPLLRRFVARLASLPSDVDLADHATRTWERHTREELSRGRHWLVALIVAAPLLGLLGTVNGMIELFASLQTRDVTAAGGQASMAGGISTALITTQLGLVTGALGL
ncbi:MAG: MotA/TolQ/ExbB proton channel family protein, partial [Myxococcota bacterium]